MVASDVAPTRLDAAVAAAQSFVAELPAGFDVGLVSFSSEAAVEVAPTQDRTAVLDALAAARAGGGTAIGEALRASVGALGPRPADAPAGEGGRVVLLLSDGTNTEGVGPLVAAAEARAGGVPVYTIAFGTPTGTIEDPRGFGRAISVPPDPESLEAVAEATGGGFFDAPDADALGRVYEEIGTQVGSRTERQDVSFAFAAAAGALLLGGGALAVTSRGRLP
jgi:Ca-activated chloride channel family protein